MKTTGVSDIKKFGLLDFLGHPIVHGIMRWVNESQNSRGTSLTTFSSFARGARCQQTFHLIIFLILSDSINIFTFHQQQNELLKDSLGICIKVRIFVYCKPFRSGAEKGDFHKFYACTTSLLQKTNRD